MPTFHVVECVYFFFPLHFLFCFFSSTFQLLPRAHSNMTHWWRRPSSFSPHSFSLSLSLYSYRRAYVPWRKLTRATTFYSVSVFFLLSFLLHLTCTNLHICTVQNNAPVWCSAVVCNGRGWFSTCTRRMFPVCVFIGIGLLMLYRSVRADGNWEGDNEHSKA